MEAVKVVKNRKISFCPLPSVHNQSAAALAADVCLSASWSSLSHAAIQPWMVEAAHVCFITSLPAHCVFLKGGGASLGVCSLLLSHVCDILLIKHRCSWMRCKCWILLYFLLSWLCFFVMFHTNKHLRDRRTAKCHLFLYRKLCI